MAGRGGLSVYTTLIPDESTPFRLQRHEHEGDHAPFVTVYVGDHSHVIHLREVATVERLLAVLAKARDWLAIQPSTEANTPRELTRS